jgi:Tol biopolymer transport system component
MGRGAALLALGCLAAAVLGAPQLAGASAAHGGAIFFADDDANLNTNVYSVNPNGHRRTRLTDPGRLDSGSPAVSPNGRKVAFEHYVFHHGSDLESSIWVMRPDGSKQKPLTSRKGAAEMPSFSADGRQIVYTEHFDIWVMDANGKNRAQLTGNRRVFDSYPVFSPNGKKIAFEREGDVWVMRADGHHAKRLTKVGTYPQFSPDGKKITFTKIENGGADDTVWVMKANGSHPKKLGNGLDSVFSPDGKKIAYTGLGPGAPDPSVSVMRANGSNTHHLTSGFTPDW